MKKIIVSDISLIKAEKQNGITLSFKEKFEIIKKLCDLSVNVIEFGSVVNNKAEEILIKTICPRLGGVKISVGVGYDVNNVEKTYELIKEAKNKRLSVSMPVSPTQIEYSLGKKPTAVMELLSSITTKAVATCDDVEVSLEDATNAETEYLYQAIRTAINCGAKTIVIGDMAGQMQPSEFSDFINNIYIKVPELKTVTLGVKLSDSLSMAVANMFATIQAGVTEIKVSTIKTENTLSTSTYLSAMSRIGAKSGYVDSLNKTASQYIIKQIENLSAEKVGISIFSASEENSDIDKNISKPDLVRLIKSRGYELVKEDLDKVYEDFLRLAGKKDVTVKELDA
ncbi:MAG: hypothetical protein IKA99_06920, partial [Clostridia bacterium]|nr:hypothetical protein [Clostridia bacterium]